MALKWLCDSGQIRRLARGLYDYPRQHPKLGQLLPTPEQIAQALTDKDSSRIQPSGAFAANLLGLSEQVPAKVVFLTDATDRHIRVGRQELILKRTTPRDMATTRRISGLVIKALRHFGNDHVDEAVIGKLAQRLGIPKSDSSLQSIPCHRPVFGRCGYCHRTSLPWIRWRS